MPALDTFSGERLNSLLISLLRSLLQYVGESWPWSSSGDQNVRQQVDALISQQRRDAERLAEWLDAQGYRLDFGSYPTEYTSLHYVSLQYLLDQLVANQQAIVRDCDELTRVREFGWGPEAAPLLSEIATNQQRILGELQHLRDAGMSPGTRT